jgi:hypothetical protein
MPDTLLIRCRAFLRETNLPPDLQRQSIEYLLDHTSQRHGVRRWAASMPHCDDQQRVVIDNPSVAIDVILRDRGTCVGSRHQHVNGSVIDITHIRTPSSDEACPRPRPDPAVQPRRGGPAAQSRHRAFGLRARGLSRSRRNVRGDGESRARSRAASGLSIGLTRDEANLARGRGTQSRSIGGQCDAAEAAFLIAL